MAVGSAFAQRIVAVLEPALGRHTAASALALVCEKSGRDADTLGLQDLEAVRKILAPMLRTLLGRAKADQVLDRLSAP